MQVGQRFSLKFFNLNHTLETWEIQMAISASGYVYIIAQFRFFNIQLQTMDFSTRLRGINYRVCGVYSPEPRGDVYCVKLNFKISKLAYSNKCREFN